MATTCNRVIPAVKGFRGNWENNRIFFQADAIELDMMLAPSGDEWTVIGQVLSEDGRLFPPLTVRLVRGEQVRTATTNYIGEFTFDDVEVPGFAIEVALPDGRVVGGFHVDQLSAATNL